MQKAVIPFATDGAGAFSTTLGKLGDPLLIFAVLVQGSNLGGSATLTLQQTNTGFGFNQTILNLASGANGNALYPVRMAETNTAGVNQTTTTLPVLDGDLNLVIANGGANKSGQVVLYLLA